MDTHTLQEQEKSNFDRVKVLERRVEELERKLARRTEQFLDEDLKVRGMK